MDFCLIHPPAVKPAEPPLGLAMLLGHLRAAGCAAEAVDANLEALLWLLDGERLSAAAGGRPGTALRRAVNHVPRALALLRSAAAADSFARYGSAVEDVNRALSAWGGEGERLTLGDYRHDRLSPFAPADLAALAGGAERTLFRRYFETSLVPRVAAAAPRYIGLSINYRHQALPAFELAGLLRRALPEAQLIAGGGLVSSWLPALRALGAPLPPFDRMVAGPGEDVLAGLAAGSAPDEALVEGAADGNFAPDYSFAELGAYFSPEPVLQVCASRGCYWARCRFCPEAVTPTQAYCCRTPTEVPALLRRLAAATGVRRFHFTDNALPPATLRALARSGSELAGLSWHGFARFEAELSDEALVRGLARSGCRMLQLGLESGSQLVLDRLRKGTDLEVAARVLHRLHAAGIASYVYVLLGTPGEERTDAEATRAFLETHADVIGYLNLALMNLPREADFPGQLPGAEWESAPLGLYRQGQPGGWDRAAVRRFLSQELEASPPLRAILRRTPRWFTSNHAPFFAPAGRL